MKSLVSLLAISTLMACHPVRKRGHGNAASQPVGIRVAVLPAESDRFPKAAKALTESLSTARVSGASDTQMSTVSLEVVQLSIECVEPTPECYEAVGKSLSANRLLFAQITPGVKKQQLKVTVTLFDVDARAPKNAEKLFTNEKAAAEGVANLVEEATQ